MNLKIKICGMRVPLNILRVSELEPDIMGFIFHRLSPRHAGGLKAEFLSEIPSSIQKAGVFVNEDIKLISSTVRMYSLDIVQLHGKEKPELCGKLKDEGISVIKAFSMSRDNPFMDCREYLSVTDYFLFDAPESGSGGTGYKFKWEVLNDYDLLHPFFLSGGISADDAGRIREIENPALCGIDLNSRFEITPGVKNTELLGNFISDIRKTEKPL